MIPKNHKQAGPFMGQHKAVLNGKKAVKATTIERWLLLKKHYQRLERIR
jgi:hypothetical protein